MGRLLSVIARPLLYADERYYLHEMDMIADTMSLPLREQKARSLDDQFEQDVPKYAILTRIITPVLDRARVAGVRADARIAGVRVLLALQAYRSRFGAYPPSLSIVEKRLGWKLPKDPFSGKALVYKPKARGFLLYSIGENLKDDGAKPLAGGVRYKEGYEYENARGEKVADIVWEMDR